MSKLDLESIIQSPEAETFLGMVTKGFYDNSYIGLWIYEVIGREWDEMHEWAEGLKKEIQPQTCTWSIDIWEWLYGIEPGEGLTLEYRRQRVLSKILGVKPINPEVIRRGVNKLLGSSNGWAEVHDCVEPYCFEVILNLTGHKPLNYAEIFNFIHEIKPAHLKMLITAISRFDTKFPNKEHFQPIILRLPFRIINSSRKIIRLNGERCLDGSWPLDQDVRSLIFQSMLVELAVREQERLSAAGAMRLQSRVGNSETLCWPQLEFGLRIGNLAFTRLNGERGLDGSWFLEQTAGGTELVSLEIQSGWQLENRAMTAGSLHSPGIKLTNKNKALEPRLQLNSWLANSNAVKQPELKLQSGWQEQNILGGGSLTRDTMWRLGGEAYLNGGKKLNAAIISENF